MNNSSSTYVTVQQKRYEALLHKEKYLEIILFALSGLSGYSDVDRLKRTLGIEKGTEVEE